MAGCDRGFREKAGPVARSTLQG
ncbi:MAG: hypothetical protein QOF50_1424, partial [Gaiellaceae bacterium]|nr:hypothetical protein [Gaiellaceae bacterium]